MVASTGSTPRLDVPPAGQAEQIRQSRMVRLAMVVVAIVNWLCLHYIGVTGCKSHAGMQEHTAVHIQVPREWIESGEAGVRTCRGEINGKPVTLAVCVRWDKIVLKNTETNREIDLMDHISEVIPQNARIGLVSQINGIRTKYATFEERNRGMAEMFSSHSEDEKPIVISLFNPTQGVVRDIIRTAQERLGAVTPIVDQYNTLLTRLEQELPPQLRMLLVPHSEGGVITRNALNIMLPEQQEKLSRRLDCIALAPAEPIPACLGRHVVNVYSTSDPITGERGLSHASNPQYEIEMVSSPSQRKLGVIGDHEVKRGSTYWNALDRRISLVTCHS